MTSRDLARLMKIDTQILELEAQLRTQLEYEGARSQRYFRLSKAIDVQIEKLKRQRINLTKSLDARYTRETVYSLVLAERKREVTEEDRKLKELEGFLHNASMVLLTSPDNEEAKDTFNALRKAIKSQTMIVHNKEKRVHNWLAMKLSNASVITAAREYTGAMHAREILGNLTHEPVYKNIEDHPLTKTENWTQHPAYMNTDVSCVLTDLKPEELRKTDVELQAEEQTPRKLPVIDFDSE